MRRFGLLLVIFAGCGHQAAGRPPTASPPDEARVSEAAEVPAAEVAAAPVGGTAAQVIRFDDDADPEPTMMVRSPPARPKIPPFQLYGTRTGDGPR